MGLRLYFHIGGGKTLGPYPVLVSGFNEKTGECEMFRVVCICVSVVVAVLVGVWAWKNRKEIAARGEQVMAERAARKSK